MCELMTIAAAAVFTVVYAVQKKTGRNASAAFTAALMFWGAALMWSVDCVANRLEGEPLFDLSRDDTMLGLLVIGAGTAVYAALCVFGSLRKREA